MGANDTTSDLGELEFLKNSYSMEFAQRDPIKTREFALEQILFSWNRKRFQLNSVICSNINMLEQIHAHQWDHKVIPFERDLL